MLRPTGIPDSSTGLPVMAFIHGGGFAGKYVCLCGDILTDYMIAGGSSSYDGTVIVAQSVQRVRFIKYRHVRFG